MIQDDKLEKVCNDFSKLNEDQKDYILGILQALVFAQSSFNNEPQSDSAHASSAVRQADKK